MADFKIGTEFADGKFYAGPNYGFVTKRKYQELLKDGSLGRGEQTAQNLLKSSAHTLGKIRNSIPKVKKTKNGGKRDRKQLGNGGYFEKEIKDGLKILKPVASTALQILDAPVIASHWLSKKVDPTGRGIGKTPLTMAEIALSLGGGAAKKGITTGGKKLLTKIDDVSDALKSTKQLAGATVGQVPVNNRLKIPKNGNGANGVNGLHKPLRAQLLPKIQRTFTPRGLGARGVVGDAQGRKVETLLARNNIAHLKNRDKNSLIATNWKLSDQAAYQKRYLSSREVKAQAHHMHDHEFWGKARDRPDGDKIEKILVNKGIRKGNDEVNMTDAWGWEKERNIFGKDHGYLHDMYNKVPERKEVLDMIENGSWNRMSPKYAANRLIAVAKQNEKITVNWAHWKLGEIYKNHPHTKLFPPKQMRKWIELNPEEAARAGSAAQMPSFKKIIGPKKHTNEMLRTVFGLKYGHKTLAKINP